MLQVNFIKKFINFTYSYFKEKKETRRRRHYLIIEGITLREEIVCGINLLGTYFGGIYFCRFLAKINCPKLNKYRSSAIINSAKFISQIVYFFTSKKIFSTLLRYENLLFTKYYTINLLF